MTSKAALKTYQEALTVLRKKLSIDQSFDMTRLCSSLLVDPTTEYIGRDLVIRGLDALTHIDKLTHPIWNDLADAAGLHPYVDPSQLRGMAALRHEIHRSDTLPDIYLHREQLLLSMLLRAGKSVIVSAPTSFGKSLLIREIVARGQFKNIVVIQPTLALLDETRRKLEPYRDRYRLIVSTTQEPAAERNIFLFTGERVVQYKHFPPIDFFVLDEFYKLSPEREDERSLVLNHAVYKLLKMTKQFYMLGPNIKAVPTPFINHYQAVWMKSDYATVAVDVENIQTSGVADQLRSLFQLLDRLDGQSMIYCSSPQRANELAQRYLNHLIDRGQQSRNVAVRDVLEWIDENIHAGWVVRRALQHGIGIHHGALPRHLTSSIVELFNSQKLRYLFCTSTLIEGVNTTAKNVILFDRTKGLKPIDYFDFRNIVGRSGRMKVHYVGRVFQYHAEPAQTEIEVDIPAFTQTRAPLELLIQLEPEDIRTTRAKELIGKFQTLDEDVQAVIKKNAGIPVESQLKVIKELESNITGYYPLLSWDQFPTYPQLAAVVELGWKYLIQPKESRGGIKTPRQLAYLVLRYGFTRSLKALIDAENASTYQTKEYPDPEERLQKVIHIILQVSLHWFRYKLPKHLSVVSELQAHVFNKHGLRPGNYSFYAGYIENSCLPEHLAALLEYGIPGSAIRKIEPLVKHPDKLPIILEKLRKGDLSKYGLLNYELQKIATVLENRGRF